jgi:hypothetical protein
VPIGDEIKAVVLGIVLEANPVLEGTEVVAYVQAARGTHAAYNALLLRVSRQSNRSFRNPCKALPS